MAPAPELHDDPLRLAERIGADQHAPLRIFVQPEQETIDLVHRLGVPEDGQPERRLGDEDVAGHRFERRAGRVRTTLVIAGDDDPLAGMFEPDLGGAEDVTGGDEAHVPLALAQGIPTPDPLSRLPSVPAPPNTPPP